MKALCQMIHEVDPEIPSTPAPGTTFRTGTIRSTSGASATTARAGRQDGPVARGGKRIWFTTDGQMCTDTPYCAIERLLPHYCFQFGAEAYEFWGVSWLTYNPFQFGWHAYIHQSSEPGRSYLDPLPERRRIPVVSRRGGRPSGHRQFGPVRTSPRRRRGLRVPASAAAVGRCRRPRRPGRAEGEQALAAAAALVAIPNAGGRYSTEILPDPERLYQVRQALAAAIETLSQSERPPTAGP
jgi:hypothetical protein